MNEFSSKIHPVNDGSKSDETVKGATESLVDAGSRVSSAASDFAKESADKLQGQASEFVDKAQNLVSDAGDRLQQKVDERKGAGVEYLGRLANSIDRAADQVQGEFPMAGSYLHIAASQVQTAADALRSGNIDDLVKGAQAFAKRQPTLFLGATFLAGFATVRFFKSSSSAVASNGERRYGDRNGSPAKPNSVKFGAPEAP